MRSGATARVAVAIVLLASRAAPAAAQRTRADSLLASGQIASAESLYYAMSDAHPRDPAARAALGEYLASRGAVRVGAVLLEEAREFGGNPAAIARALAPMYRTLGDYRALLTLRPSPLTVAERAQAVWLVDHPPSLAMPESSLVRIQPAGAPALFSMRVNVNGHSVLAIVDARHAGVILPTSWRPRATALFGGTAASSGSAAEVSMGGVTLGNMPVSFEHGGGVNDVRMGLDVLARFAPTVDIAAGRMVLHSGGDPGRMPDAMRFPTITDSSGVRVLIGGRLEPLEIAAASPLLRGRRWTFDAQRGELIVHR